MQWWCSAQTAAWTWSWRPYPGVWLFVLTLGIGCWLVRRRFRATTVESAKGETRTGPRTGSIWFLTGLATVWLALDWPLGPLGAGYLASAHMLQMLLLSLLAPPLLLSGIPRTAYRRLAEPKGAGSVLRRLTHPVAALLLFNAVVVGTHVPGVLDTLSSTQAGMFTMDLLWLTAGILFWWPVLVPFPRRSWFTPPFQIGYLFLNTVPVTVPYSFLVFAELPLYATYELAPPVAGISSLTDQQVAGLLMKFGGGAVLWTAITILFFRWYRRDGEGPLPRRPLVGPAAEASEGEPSATA